MKSVQECRNKLLLAPDSSHSLLSESGWLDRNRILDDQATIQKITDYIKQNWDLDEKYLFTIEKMDTSSSNDSTCHVFKVNFFIIIIFNKNFIGFLIVFKIF